jgi:hypothetical protein
MDDTTNIGIGEVPKGWSREDWEWVHEAPDPDRWEDAPPLGGAATEDEIEQLKTVAFTKFAKLGFKKIKAMVSNGYEDLDAQDVAFAIEWLRNSVAKKSGKC